MLVAVCLACRELAAHVDTRAIQRRVRLLCAHWQHLQVRCEMRAGAVALVACAGAPVYLSAVLEARSLTVHVVPALVEVASPSVHASGCRVNAFGNFKATVEVVVAARATSATQVRASFAEASIKHAGTAVAAFFYTTGCAPKVFLAPPVSVPLDARLRRGAPIELRAKYHAIVSARAAGVGR